LIAWSYTCKGHKNETSIPQEGEKKEKTLLYKVQRGNVNCIPIPREKSFEQLLLPFQHQEALLKLRLLFPNGAICGFARAKKSIFAGALSASQLPGCPLVNSTKLSGRDLRRAENLSFKGRP
jgi:hypothetical protein